jgi:hypothetical protein
MSFIDKLLGRSPTDHLVPKDGLVQSSMKNESSLSNSVASSLNKSIVTGTINTTFHDLGSSSYNHLSVFTEKVNSKSELMTKLDSIRDNEYVELILREVASDVLNRNYSSTDSYIKVTIENDLYKNLEDNIQSDIHELRLYNLLQDIIEDYLFYGQYVLSLNKDNSEYYLDDDIDQRKVIPASSKGRIKKLFNSEDSKLYDSSNYLILNLYNGKKSNKITSSTGVNYTTKLPKGLFPESIIAKFNSLKILESLQPIIEMQAIDEKMFFYIRFPSGKDVSEAYKEVRNYEKLLKSLISVDTTNTTNVNDILDRVTNLKVVPLFGNQEEVRASSPVNKINRIDLNQINDLRKSISKSVGIDLDNESDHRSPQYLKLIKRIRELLRISIESFIVDFINKKYNKNLTIDDVTITLPEVQGADEVDSIEYLTLINSSFNQIQSVIRDTEQIITDSQTSSLLDPVKIYSMYSQQLNKITGVDLLVPYETFITNHKSNKDNDISDDEEESSGTSSESDEDGTDNSSIDDGDE